MNITINHDGAGTVLALHGRLDTAAAATAKVEIEKLLASEEAITSLVCDASGLEYISSSGLRLVLSLAKKYKGFRMVETSAEVYQVMEMTGFTQIMTVEKALRRMSVDGCDIIGRGGVGTVYRIDDDTIIKVFRPGTTINDVRTEIAFSKEAFVKGMPTAISYDVVHVGSQYGLVYELLRADTLSACVRREPQNIDRFARLYASLFRQLHSIEVEQGGVFPDARQRMMEAVERISRYFDTKAIGLMKEIVEAIPQSNRLLHCDLQSKNAMLQGDELMLIDMGEVAFGHPVIDLAHSYSPMMNLVGDYEAITGLPETMAHDLWQRMAAYYFEDMPSDVVARRMEQIKAVACLRGVTWLSLSDSFPDEVVQECRNRFDKQVVKQKDYILGVCATLTDWKL